MTIAVFTYKIHYINIQQPGKKIVPICEETQKTQFFLRLEIIRNKKVLQVTLMYMYIHTIEFT